MSNRFNPTELGLSPQLEGLAEMSAFTVPTGRDRAFQQQFDIAHDAAILVIAALDAAGVINHDAIRPDILTEAYDVVLEVHNDSSSLEYLKRLSDDRYQKAYGSSVGTPYVYPEAQYAYERYADEARNEALTNSGFTDEEIHAQYLDSELTEREEAAQEFFMDLYLDQSIHETSERKVELSKLAGWLHVLVGDTNIETVDQQILIREASGNLTPDEAGLAYMRETQARMRVEADLL